RNRALASGRDDWTAPRGRCNVQNRLEIGRDRDPVDADGGATRSGRTPDPHGVVACGLLRPVRQLDAGFRGEEATGVVVESDLEEEVASRITFLSGPGRYAVGGCENPLRRDKRAGAPLA